MTSRSCVTWWDDGSTRSLRPGTKRWLVSAFLVELDDTPDAGCYADVLAYIKTVRAEVYSFPCLRAGKGQPRPEGLGPSRDEWERRDTERTLMRELSQYYQRRPEDRFWRRPLLLKEGEDLCDHSPRQQRSAYLCSLQCWRIWRSAILC